MTDVRPGTRPRPESPPTPPPRPPWVLAAWTSAAVVVPGWLALVEVLWLPLRIGGVLVPLSVVAAAFGNPLLVWAARRASGSRLVAALPAVAWLVVVLAASTRRAEGDLLVIGGGTEGAVNLAFLLIGIVAAAAAVGRVATDRAPRRQERTQPGARR